MCQVSSTAQLNWNKHNFMDKERYGWHRDACSLETSSVAGWMKASCSTCNMITRSHFSKSSIIHNKMSNRVKNQVIKYQLRRIWLAVVTSSRNEERKPYKIPNHKAKLEASPLSHLLDEPGQPTIIDLLTRTLHTNLLLD